VEIPTFGTLLRQYRLAAGLTQMALAERAGLSLRGLSDLARGESERAFVAAQIEIGYAQSAMGRARIHWWDRS
jgi:transcriptional regulator with XRE-family HTH domain